MQPIYDEANTSPAFQLNWTVSLFGKTELPAPSFWLDKLKTATEQDGARILSCETRSKSVVQFLISTRPALPPSDIVRSVKGRLQYLIRDEIPKAFRRNYHIQSVGHTKSDVLDEYVARQNKKHPMVDSVVQARLELNQFHDAAVDLKKPSVGTYGQYLNSLHIVLENSEGWNEVHDVPLKRTRDIIVRASEKKQWRLSRIGLLANHVHILLGASVTESPQSVVLSLMNNVAFANGIKPMLRFGYYVGTFGGYDRGAIRSDFSR